MKFVKPKVFLIAETAMLQEGLDEYLSAIGAVDWYSKAPSDSEQLVEVGGRLCYKSFGIGLNPNITKVREGNDKYLQNILSSKHGAVVEHASVTFIFHNVSRTLTHELVRHRVGCAISQESLRFVRLTEIPMWIPDCIAKDNEAVVRGVDLVVRMEEYQQWLARHYKLDEDQTFATKKFITSAMRRFANMGVATSIMWTANFRTLRHVLEIRTSKHAEEEIRMVFDEVGSIVKKRFPNLFQDFERNDDGEWQPKYSKI